MFVHFDHGFRGSIDLRRVGEETQGRWGSYHFLNPEAAQRLLSADVMECASSNQNWFATLTKSAA